MKQARLLSCFVAAAVLLAGVFPLRASAAGAHSAAVETGEAIEYWCMWEVDEARGLVVAEAAKAFTKASGVDVQVYYLGRDVKNVLLPALEAGEVVDVFDGEAAYLLDTWGKYLLPLDDFVNAAYADTANQPYRETQTPLFWQFAEELQTARGFAEGSANLVPYAPEAYAMTANRDIMKLAGYKEYPKTWTEFEAICKTLKAAGVTPITADDVYLPALFYATLSSLAGDGEYARIIETGDYAAPAVAETCALWGAMVEKGYVSKKAAANKYPHGQMGQMAAGSTVFYFGPSSFTAEVRGQDGGFQWGRFALPGQTAGAPYALLGTVNAFGIHRATAAPSAAFAFVRLLTTGEWDEKFAADSYGIPAAANASYPAKPDGEQALVEQAETFCRLPTGKEADTIKTGFQQLIKGDIGAQGFAALLAEL